MAKLKVTVICLFVGLGSLLASCAGGGQSRLMDGVAVSGGSQDAQRAPEEYKINPQDKISINVYPDKTFSIPDVRVSADGTILLPPLGLILVQGRTASELGAELQKRLADCCLQRPQVAVQVTDTVSQQITVMGAVKAPNAYNLRGRTTLLQAVTMAGGPDNALANTKRIGVIRYTDGKRTGKIFNLQDIQAGRAEDPLIVGGDEIIVDTSDGKSTWRGFVQAMPLASIFMLF